MKLTYTTFLIFCFALLTSGFSRELAPQSINDAELEGSVLSGSGSFARAGTFTLLYQANGRSQLTKASANFGERKSSFVYTRIGPNVATIDEYFDSNGYSGPMRTTLRFNSPTEGTATAAFISGNQGRQKFRFHLSFLKNDFVSPEEPSPTRTQAALLRKESSRKVTVNNVPQPTRASSPSKEVNQEPALVDLPLPANAESLTPVAMRVKGEALCFREETETLRTQGFALLQTAAKRGDARAMTLAGNALATGMGVKFDIVSAVAWYRKADRSGDGPGTYRLAVCTESGLGVLKDKTIANALYSKAHTLCTAPDRRNDGYALSRLGNMYFFGNGVETDLHMALNWYQKGADLGDISAIHNSADSYLYGKGIAPDFVKALELFHKAAALGDGASMNAIGAIYQNGSGVDKNSTKAVEWYQKAAGFGCSSAMSNLANCYANGDGVPKDYRLANEWRLKGSEAGSSACMTNLGLSYYNGNAGLEKNERKAVMWFRKAALAGEGIAMANLGECYQDGIGVLPNREYALQWYRLAIESGDADAIKMANGNIAVMRQNDAALVMNILGAIMDSPSGDIPDSGPSSEEMVERQARSHEFWAQERERGGVDVPYGMGD